MAGRRRSNDNHESRKLLYYDDFVTLDSTVMIKVYVGALSLHYEALSVEASKQTTAEEIVSCIVERLGLTGNNYELAEVAGECKERRLSPHEKPVSVMLLWPMHSEKDFHRFYLRERQSDVPWLDNYGLDPQILRDFIPFLLQKENREYPDLCQLPDLNEATLLENLRQRFEAGHIYTYVGSILIAVNPFKFHPIYNPKYVRLYQNQRIGPILPPHIFAIADNAYYNMLKEKRNQCIVISGESGSGKTESTNFLLHHLTALSQKGAHGSGVEQTILSAGPVLEAFGNAKTAHNNNSSRFGKFIQVNYRENGMVQGAVVQKYLLEKSRIVSQGHYERNYHVFYYLLSGATEQERVALHLLPAEKYHYLNAKNLTLENCDEKYEFSRLKQSMEMVGFSAEKQRRLFAVLSAVLLLGNVEFFPKKSTYHHDESVQVRNPDVVGLISELLRVKQETLLSALTSKRVKASGETLIMQYKLPEAIAARDALAKCLYGALFDWIVLQVNHALLNKDQTVHTGHSIGVLDIFGFEDFGLQNSFEQLCINYANEHLQYYFNLHVFKYEQKEYKRESIKWTDIEFLDNSGCLQLFESKPSGLLCILDDLCNFPGATNETLLQKFNSVHKDNLFYEKPQRKENAFIIKHYAGKVKYQVAEMREKNLDLMRQDIVSVLKNSSMAFVRELVGADPVAVFRWAILRAFFRGYFAFRSAGIKHRKERADQSYNKLSTKSRYRAPNESIVSSGNAGGISYRQSVGPGTTQAFNNRDYASGTPRRSWSSYAFNNKNFPDGKISYECQQQQQPHQLHQQQQQPPSPDSSSTSGHQSSNASSSGKQTTATNAGGSLGNIGGKLDSASYNSSQAARNRFERSTQDVMARASQIVMKNKSFRPRERPKKGLKNLQSVKTLSAGQNLTNNQTAIKTRKQPLTVTAQFQNSLIALMETLNQANPFFIRCIKSNPNKIPNQFDDATVTRQLRYTGMLETVRIRRAGYNVRLTYEEFIQLYRILLPKGLVSSQKDVRDFMNTMDLNKQHYQLGLTKIYMRESQKMRLDICLHTKIIDGIITIQRWFRSILQRKKYCQYRSAACTIQSHWRLYLKEKQAKFVRKIKTEAAIIIQAVWRGHSARKWFNKLKSGVMVIQARIRGNQARERFKVNLSKKLQRERAKLRSTQSLPTTERILESSFDTPEIQQHKAIGTKIQSSQAVGVSFESAIDIVNKNRALFSDNSLSSADFIDDDDDDDEEDDDDCYEDMGLVDDPTFVTTVLRHETLPEKNTSSGSTKGSGLMDLYGSSQQHVKVPLKRQDDVLDRPMRKYEIDRASKSTFDDAELAKYRYERGLSSLGGISGKLPVRRVDSGPSPGHRVRYDAYGSGSAGLTSGGMIRNQNHSNNSFSSSNVEIVLVNSGIDSLSSSVATSGIANSSASGSGTSLNTSTIATEQPQKLPLQRNLNRNTISQTQQSSTTLSRRELICRSQGDEINSNYHLHHLQSAPSIITSLSSAPCMANYQNVQYTTATTAAFHQQQQQQQQQHIQQQQHQQPHPYNNNNNNNNMIKSTSISNVNSNSGSTTNIYSYVSQQQSPHQQQQQQQQQFIPPGSAQSNLPLSQRVTGSYPDEFAQNYYNTTTTPKGKAAALLGTKSEDCKYGGGKDIDLTLSSAAATAAVSTIAPSKTRRMKTNLSDDFSGTITSGNDGSNTGCPGGNSTGQTALIRRGAIAGMDTLKRRNSDPTNKIPLLEVNRGNDMYQSSTRINIAGHQFRKVQRINKAEKCASCQESDSFVNEGYRCLDCKVLVHTKCIQNGGIKSLQCAAKRSKRIRTGKHEKHAPIGGLGNTSTPNSKFSATREYTDSTDKIISDAKELQLMQDFITQKICKMESDCEKPSEVDRVFKQALREFKDNLVAQYSVAHKQNSDVLNIKYRDLISNFEQVIETTSGRKNDFPLTMGVNAFRGFMNEFMNSRETEKPKAKRKKDKKRKHDEHTTYNGHTFQLTIINIATACEICQQFLLWPIERGLVCQNCRLTCHKRCYTKSFACSKIANTGPLGPGGTGVGVTGVMSGGTTVCDTGDLPTKLFGVPLTGLCAGNDGVKIPAQIYSLIMMIEMHGLYSEGIYRKSGVSSKIKELKGKMDRGMGTSDEMDYESYNVHVLTNVLKSFLREMPEPLLTFDRYDDFLRAADLSDGNDRVQTLLSLIKKIPPAHHCLLERLIFHLALVAKLEQYNRMSASSLAIVFAPCVLRTNRYVPAQDSLNDIGRQTKCMETLITQKMLNVKSTLADIDTLDTAAHTATTRLSTLRSSKVFTQEEMTANARGGGGSLETETEEMLLEGHIQEIKKEKALLTSTLPSLARASSDDDLLSTDLDGEGGSLDDLSSSKDKDLDSSYNNVISDSGISIRYQPPSDHGSSNVSLNNDVAMAVSYNLREQSIDYFHKVGKTKSLSHQTLVEREAFLKSGSQSGSATTPQSPTTTITTSSSSPSSSAPSMIKSQNGSTSSVSNNSTSSKRSDSQQLNLSHSMVTLSTGVGCAGSASNSSSSTSDLQRQKPVIMRSISGGYEPSSSISGASSSQKILIQQSASIPIASSCSSSLGNVNNNSSSGSSNNSNVLKDNKEQKMNRRMSGNRRQNSGGGPHPPPSSNISGGGSGNNGDDEPIMV
ncbi:unconventional myosin-IXa-like isoform X4 [Toxorhynchites rutilus septentrionalis]|uniref:unconventional myosin-IXa-like isoform X4 n=1 Tax=Toxorhynchites rutilus septentrionalis TaxID=329112 RepID=UPI00247861C0|nr:unconventional myosin-IXa-like isoform X4 [Toxorhynchites rutilus septentrionalis]